MLRTHRRVNPRLGSRSHRLMRWRLAAPLALARFLAPLGAATPARADPERHEAPQGALVIPGAPSGAGLDASTNEYDLV